MASHGRQPTAREVIALRQQATLATRDAKHAKSLAELDRRVARPGRAGSSIDDPPAWVALAERPTRPAAAAPPTTWRRGSCGMPPPWCWPRWRTSGPRSPARTCSPRRYRQLHGVRFAAPAERITVAERVATLAAPAGCHAHPRRRPRVPRSTCTPGRVEHAARPQQRGLRHARSSSTPRSDSWPPGSQSTGPVVQPSVAARLGRMAVPGRDARAVRGAGRRGVPPWSPPGAASTCSSARPGPGSRPPWPASAPRGRPPTGRVGGRARALRGRRGGPRRRRRRADREHRQVAHREPRGSPSARRGCATAPRAWPARSPSPGHARTCNGEAAAEMAAYRRWCLRPGSWSSSTRHPWPRTVDLDYLTAVAAQGGGEGAARRRLGAAVPGAGRRRVQAPRRLTVATRSPTLHDVRRFRHEWERDATAAAARRRP